MREKIKSVEIEAFRIYNQLQTFNFEKSNGEIADLVVIYAPNGYGKTSFFDAIEWSLTGDVSRLNGSPSVKQTAKKENGSILKNFHSVKEVGSVKITTDQANVLHLNTKRLIEGYRLTDLKEGDIVEKSESFKQLDSKKYLASNMLSQDKIDSFLKFTSPKERYDVFKPFWDVDNETDTYTKVLTTLSIGEKKIKELKKQIKQNREELSQISNTNESLNDLNILINIHNEGNISKIPNILIDSDEKEVSTFIKKITEMEVDFERSLNTSYKKIKMIEDATIIKRNLDKKIKVLENINYEINEKTNLRNQFHKYQKRKEEIKTHRKDLNNWINDLRIIKSMKEYINTDKEYKKIIVKMQQIFDSNKILNSEEKLMTKEIENENNQKITLNLYKKELESLNKNVSDVYKLRDLFNENEIKRERFNKINKKVKQFNNRRFDEISKIEEKIDLVEVWSKFSVEKLLDENLVIPNFIKNEVRDLKNLMVEIKELNYELQKSLNSIENYKETNSIINNLISMGREVVLESKLSDCPLCNSKFSNFENLLNNINSQVLNLDIIEDVEKKIKILNKELIKINEKKDIKYKNIKNTINHETNKLINEKLLQNKNISKNDLLLIKAKKQLEIATDNLKYICEKLGISSGDLENIKSINNFVEKSIKELTKKISKENERINEADLEINKNSLLLKKREVKIKSKKRDLNILVKEIDQLKEQETFKNFEKNKQKISIESEDESIVTELNKKEQSLLSLLKIKCDSRRKIIKTIYGLDEDVKRMNLLEINNFIEEENKKKDELQNSIDSFNENLKSDFNKDQISLEEIERILNEELDVKDLLQKTIENIKKIKSYIEVLNKNTIRNNKNRLLNQLTIQKNNIEQVNKDLKELVSLGKEYISSKVDEFFNVDALNTIYQRIDPHPEFRTIKFEPSFPDNNPEINMYAQNSESTRSPILYFSAAQLNLLSLSVFLARALENEQSQLNTIFMDDPVQHLDSINILSFIDLLRSIALYSNRQVVISTHNENLFNLIKRKIDPKYTNSKYINLSSFGRVKN